MSGEAEALVGHEEPKDQGTQRERLHKNIERLRVLDEQLFWDRLKEEELLIEIELVAFKTLHLASHIRREHI